MSNKFLSFGNNTVNTSTGSTFVIDAASKILSIEIKVDDEFVEIPNAYQSGYNVIQYRKNIQTNRDIVFTYSGLQKAKIYHHHQQTVRFHRFITPNGESTWIC
jgi:hypothetical protein